MKAGRGQNPAILGFPSPCQPTVSEGCNPQHHFMRPFAPCFASAGDGQPIYLLIRVQIDLAEPFVTMVRLPAGVPSQQAESRGQVLCLRKQPTGERSYETH
jgi:hypothetical protein